ncbi:MAG: GAF domain-containing protein [Mucilaginibacter sp.]
MTDQYRLTAVNRFKKPDAEINDDLNSIIELVARICDTPVALITLVDDDTQWFKVSRGIDIDCTDRELAFCNHTIQQDGLMIINNTLEDDRFKHNPMVTGAPHLRFYAGATLTTKDGHAIGSLCVLDFKPRTLDKHQKESLKVLSKQVMNLMELNWSLDILQQQHAETNQQKQHIEESEIKLKAMFNSSKETHILVDKQLKVVAFNKAASEFVREAHRKKITKGKSIMDYADPEVIPGLTHYFNMAFGGKTIEFEWLMRPDTDRARWKELQLLPIRNGAKKIIGVALNSTDITDRKLKEEQIRIQNAALTRIAIIQSHELRRPVASLLGFVSLIKMEKGKFDYFDMIELTVNELDEKIRGIVKDSEDTIHNKLAIVA